ncbi:MAG: glycosyltransferase [Ilumatobacteraceae bacterium]
MNPAVTTHLEPVTVSVRPHLRHLWRLSTPLGLYEHCDRTNPRVEHGYCTDDSARLLVLAAREPGDAFVETLAERAVRFLEHAHRGRGRFANRRDTNGVWLDNGCDDDACGRALWGLGEAASSSLPEDVRARAVRLFDHAAEFRSRHLRSTAFAVLGAARVLAAVPESFTARAVLTDAARRWAESPTNGNGSGRRRRWPWPEERLTYGNAVIPEMLLVAGAATGDRRMYAAGIELLRWLVDTETGRSGWLSVTPAGGWAPGEPRPGFDQQPIEVAALADAAATAARLDGATAWRDVVDLSARWFLGHNDVGAPMVDWATGGGFDGLTPTGPNLNEGAESTMAAITTMQHARRMLHLS